MTDIRAVRLAKARAERERAAEPVSDSLVVPDIAPVVNIQVVRTCNLRCTFCSHDVWAKPEGMMEFGLFETIISSLRNDGCKTICFVSAQGESLLHPLIFDMLELSQHNGFETNLVTNGTPLNEKRIAKLSQLGLNSIQFSFAGWDKGSYEQAYVGGKFEQVSNNLEQLIRAIRGKNTVLSINGVCSDQDGIEKTRAFLKLLGANDNEIRLQVPHNWGGTVKTPFESSIPPKVCPLLISTPGIYIDGHVTACGCIDANGALGIGDITKNRLSDIRRGDRYKSIIRAFQAKDVSWLPLCAKCEIPYQ